MRMTWPTVVGVRPRLEPRMAFSTTATMVFSNGVMVSERASATATLATWVKGTSEP